MNPDVTVQEHIMSAGKIEGSMIKDHPVVPPDSIIKTFTHLKGDDVDLVLSQDKEGLSIGSFFIRNTDWSRFFCETWFDPIYRSYNFQKAEAHALVSAHPDSWRLASPLRGGARLTATTTAAGTYRPVASYHPVQAGAGPPADDQLVQQGQPRNKVREGRPCRAARGVRESRHPRVRGRSPAVCETVARSLQDGLGGPGRRPCLSFCT